MLEPWPDAVESFTFVIEAEEGSESEGKLPENTTVTVTKTSPTGTFGPISFSLEDFEEGRSDRKGRHRDREEGRQGHYFREVQRQDI